MELSLCASNQMRALLFCPSSWHCAVIIIPSHTFPGGRAQQKQEKKERKKVSLWRFWGKRPGTALHHVRRKWCTFWRVPLAQNSSFWHHFLNIGTHTTFPTTGFSFQKYGGGGERSEWVHFSTIMHLILWKINRGMCLPQGKYWALPCEEGSLPARMPLRPG